MAYFSRWSSGDFLWFTIFEWYHFHLMKVTSYWWNRSLILIKSTFFTIKAKIVATCLRLRWLSGLVSELWTGRATHLLPTLHFSINNVQQEQTVVSFITFCSNPEITFHSSAIYQHTLFMQLSITWDLRNHRPPSFSWLLHVLHINYHKEATTAYIRE